MSVASKTLRYLGLGVGAIVFLFPFWYMLIGSLQKSPDSGLSSLLPIPGHLTLHNFAQMNGFINVGRSLVNSGIYTAGVLVCTLFFGMLVGYALATLQFRGRGVVFAAALLVQVVPFQLLMIPLYVMVTVSYGLSDSFAGMILPSAISSGAVIIFRQFFVSLPKDLFESARMDGAGEFRILASIAVPLARPALLTVALTTFIGPWNEFLWPFLITKDPDKQPLAVALANFMGTLQPTLTNPYGALLAGGAALAVPVIVLFVIFQRHFVQNDVSAGVKG
ncbi:carbohydrate ABC transporter permease [Microlunatus soli]|uniref:Multiple sugar transport system permease protein n=1 Tax=Microlunatus soli TaxID=630515 RepID=A0A1H1ZAN1_9ACTN|nr:carbohydrate ABC transporter permease [Microlunatus soli]SDT30669.1 multiple sugar transport system permease protein [Microlunatus soli]